MLPCLTRLILLFSFPIPSLFQSRLLCCCFFLSSLIYLLTFTLICLHPYPSPHCFCISVTLMDRCLKFRIPLCPWTVACPVFDKPDSKTLKCMKSRGGPKNKPVHSPQTTKDWQGNCCWATDENFTFMHFGGRRRAGNSGGAAGLSLMQHTAGTVSPSSYITRFKRFSCITPHACPIHPPATHSAKRTSISEMCEMCCQITEGMAVYCMPMAQPIDLCKVKSCADRSSDAVRSADCSQDRMPEGGRWQAENDGSRGVMQQWNERRVKWKVRKNGRVERRKRYFAWAHI